MLEFLRRHVCCSFVAIGIGYRSMQPGVNQEMKCVTSLWVLTVILVLAFSGPVFPMNPPETCRARTAADRVRPFLEDELLQLGVKWGSAVFLRIFKKERTLELWVRHTERFILFKTYEICNYGPRGLGPKMREGDKRAPEGFYRVTSSALNPASDYHLSFNVGYPNAHDRARGWTGSAIMVHGGCRSWGCYALSDEDIEEVYVLVEAALKNGQRGVDVHVFPFRMTSANMRRCQGHSWEVFWNNLKTGYDMFHKNGNRLPVIDFKNQKYVFRTAEESGYEFDPSSVVEHNMHIKAEAWFVPGNKQYFRQYFNDAMFDLVQPYKEEFTLLIEPVHQHFAVHDVVIRDSGGRLIELGPKGTTGWRSVEFAQEGLKRLVGRICARCYR